MNDLIFTGRKKYLDYRFSTGHWLFYWQPASGKYGAQIIINDITAERAELAVEKLHQGGYSGRCRTF